MIKKYIATSLMLMATTAFANPIERAGAHQEWAMYGTKHLEASGK